MEFPGATEADINWLQDCFVQFLKDKVARLFDDNDNDNDNDNDKESYQYHYNINWLVSNWLIYNMSFSIRYMLYQQQ